MTRMSKEFTLVLLGSGVLTAGYFTVPSAEEEMEKKAEDQAAERGPGTAPTRGYRTGLLRARRCSSGSTATAYAGTSSPVGRPPTPPPPARAGSAASGAAFSGGGSVTPHAPH